MNFQIGPHAKNRDFAIEPRRVAQDLGEEEPCLVVHLHLLAVVAGHVEILPNRVVHRAGVGELLLPFLPLRQRPDLRALAIGGSDIKLGNIGRHQPAA